MDEEEKKVLKHALVRLVKELDPQQLLPHLPCLTQQSREKIEADQKNEGKSYAINTLYEHLIRRPPGFKQLINALRDPGIDHADLADDLTASLVTGRRHSPSSRGIRGSREVPNGANNWTSKLPDSSGLQRRLSCATERPTIDTQWRNLPVKIHAVLRKLDIGDGLKKPADLAGLFDFTIADIDEIKSQTPPGDSLTLAIIKCQSQRSPVTLGCLFKAFYDLGRIDILHELEETTGVTFERPAEREIFRGTEGSQQVKSESLSRMERVSNRDRIDTVNINHSIEKPVGYKKSVTNEKECQESRQTAERVPQKYVHANEDSKHNIVEPRDNCKLNVKDEKSLEEVSRTGQGMKGLFIGYKPEEILNNMAGIGTSPLGILEEKPEKKEENREILSSLPYAQVNVNENLPPIEPQQDEGDETFVNYENNLGRSNSSCSSNTDNNDSLNCQPEDLHAGDSEKFEIDNSSVFETSGGKINVWDRNIGKCNGNVLKHGEKQLGSELEVDAGLDNSDNYLQLTGSIQTPNGTSEQLLDAKSVKAEFDKMLLEEKLKGDNLSNIWSAHSSVKYSSIKSRHDRQKQGEAERTSFMSAENYVDHSLEDNKIPIPKLSIGSQDMLSIERKAGKKFPGDEKLQGNENYESHSYQKNSDGSYDIDWDLSERGEGLSTDGEKEWQRQEIRDVGPTYGQYFGQSQENGKLRTNDLEQTEVATTLANRNDELDVKESKEINQGNTFNSNVDSKDFEKHNVDEKSELKCFEESNNNKWRSRHELCRDGKLDSSDVERQDADTERVSEGTGHKHDSMEEASYGNRPTVITHGEINSNENELRAGMNQRLRSVKDLLKKCFTVLEIVYENSV